MVIVLEKASGDLMIDSTKAVLMNKRFRYQDVVKSRLT